MFFCRRLLPIISSVLFSVLSFAQNGALLQHIYKPSSLNGTVASFFKDIKKQTGISISYSTYYINPEENISLTGKETTIQDVLNAAASGTKVSFAERRSKILIVPLGDDKKTLNEGTTINGYIKDAQTKEALIGAIITLPSRRIGTVSNSFGFYSLTVPKGNNTVFITYIGYKLDTVAINCDENHRLDVALQPANTLTEVKITSGKNDKLHENDLTRLSPSDINRNQTLLGENDVMRALQNIPGVQAGIDGSSSITVRGGDPGQNLHLLDGIPLYYVDHFFGLTSVYNSEAIKSVDFYKGAFPSRYGGRLSSIVDVHTKDGDMERVGGEFTMGLLKATLNLEGPIVKDKASFMISARRTWADGLVTLFTDQLGINFYDINAKGNWIVNKNNNLYVSFYTGRDQLRYSENGDNYLRTRWGNTIASVKWTSVLGPKFFLNTILTYSLFRYELRDHTQSIDTSGINNTGNYVGVSTINEGAFKIQGQWFPKYNQKVELGLGYAYSFFAPTKLESVDAKIPLPVNPVSNEFFSNEATLYVEDEIKLGSKWLVRPGVHYVNWFSSQFNYSSAQPRLYVSFAPSQKHLIYASASHMAQFLHLISNNSYGLPTDFWVPSTGIIKPEQAWLGTLGYSAKHKKLKYSAEAYYKDVNGVIAYTTGKNIFDNSTKWQNRIIQGKGWSYGLEMSAEDTWGPLNVSLAYTLSWNYRQFAELNNGDPFPYRYDRRHNLKIGANYKLTDQTELSANWTYMSGEAFTLPDQIYPDLDNSLHIFQTGSVNSASYTYNYTQWNGYRLPAVHRLDIGATFSKTKRDHYERVWAVGIFNVYNRKNVMFVTLTNDSQTGSFKLQGISLLQFIPYISYKLKF